jgi:hypothetical protein
MRRDRLIRLLPTLALLTACAGEDPKVVRAAKARREVEAVGVRPEDDARFEVDVALS